MLGKRRRIVPPQARKDLPKNVTITSTPHIRPDSSTRMGTVRRGRLKGFCDFSISSVWTYTTEPRKHRYIVTFEQVAYQNTLDCDGPLAGYQGVDRSFHTTASERPTSG